MKRWKIRQLALGLMLAIVQVGVADSEPRR